MDRLKHKHTLVTDEMVKELFEALILFTVIETRQAEALVPSVTVIETGQAEALVPFSHCDRDGTSRSTSTLQSL